MTDASAHDPTVLRLVVAGEVFTGRLPTRKAWRPVADAFRDARTVEDLAAAVRRFGLITGLPADPILALPPECGLLAVELIVDQCRGLYRAGLIPWRVRVRLRGLILWAAVTEWWDWHIPGTRASLRARDDRLALRHAIAMARETTTRKGA